MYIMNIKVNFLGVEHLLSLIRVVCEQQFLKRKITLNAIDRYLMQ